MMVYTATSFKRKKKKAKMPVARKLSKQEVSALRDPAPLPVYKQYDRTIASLNSEKYNTNRREVMTYSGERRLIGIATMHKSNLVPVFEDNKEVAVEIAKMRRN